MTSVVATMLAATGPVGTAGADEISAGAQVSDDGSKIVSSGVDGRTVTLEVYSAAMDKNITVNVQRPKDASVPRPVLYLLNGAGGGTDSATWQAKTDVVDFLAEQNVNTVMPVGGKFSYYTDWKQDDPVLGRNKWRTFLLDELPPLVDRALGTNGVQAIAANSMSATAVLQLAIARPGFYSAAAGYSGCAQISDPVGQQFVKLVTETWGGGDVRNMYGEPDDPAWRANDPVVGAEGLRGTALFISNGTGQPGPHDEFADPATFDPTAESIAAQIGVANQIALGGVIESAVNWCTHNLQNRLDELQIPATFDFDPVGTHSWGYWQDAFHASWPTLVGGLDAAR
ncbi:alpha/beta hydrolase [Rhodococcoides yunnanense]|uniref:alpha/beta hydrolase n=1 Tax=Rhodococcoides yunnanense TaxID=278209 RepID=UPI000934F674